LTHRKNKLTENISENLGEVLKMTKELRKFIDVVVLIVCLSFVLLAFFAHFVLKTLLFRDFVISVLFFGMGFVVQLISLTARGKEWHLDRESLTRKQLISLSACCLIFGICALALAFISESHIIVKIILLVGFLFFGTGGLVLLARREKNNK